MDVEFRANCLQSFEIERPPLSLVLIEIILARAELLMICYIMTLSVAAMAWAVLVRKASGQFALITRMHRYNKTNWTWNICSMPLPWKYDICNSKLGIALATTRIFFLIARTS